MAQGQGRPRALMFCKRGLRFLNNHAEQYNTITTDSRFALKTLEFVAFTTGQSSAYPRAVARHTGGNGGYAGQTRLATTEVRADHHLQLNAQGWVAVMDSEAHCRRLQQRAAIHGGGATVPACLRPNGKVEMVEKHP